MQVSPGWCPLHHACFAGFVDRARQLLLEGADERMRAGPPERLMTPAQLAQAALGTGPHAASMQLLIQRAMLPFPREQALFPPVLRGQGLVIMLVHRRLAWLGSTLLELRGPAV